MGIDWSLANGPNAFERGMQNSLNVMTAFRQGRDYRRQEDVRKALSVLSSNPDDPQARAVVMQNAPELAMKLADFADQRAYRAALADYIAPQGQPNALLGLPSPAVAQTPAPVTNAPQQAPQPINALAGVSTGRQPSSAFAEAFQPYQMSHDPAARDIPPGSPAPDVPGTPSLRDAASLPAPQEAKGADLSILGQPQNGRDRAFLAMVQRDPIQALKIQSALRDNFLERLKGEHEFYGMAIDDLSNATDEASWQAGLHRLAPMAQALGGDLLAHVPPTYPGPVAVQQLLEQALPVKERLDYVMRAANVEADNARQDRNTDSLITDRETRRNENRRYHDQRLNVTVRGQNMTDKRVRTSASYQGRGGKGATRPTATGPNGEKVEWNGKAWVPAK